MWTPEGVDIEGSISLTLTQIASDSEEGFGCAQVPADDDADGFIGSYFDGDDCDDTSASLLGLGDCDGDGAPTEEDCNDLDATVFPGADEVIDDDIDQDCDGSDDITCSISGWHLYSTAEELMTLEHCAVIDGSINLGGEHVNVDALHRLTEVTGELAVRDIDSLENLDGLSRLTSVGLSLYLTNLPSLTNIDALSNLTVVGRDVQLQVLPGLTNIDGLSSLTSAQGLVIRANEALEHVDGLSSLHTLGEETRPFSSYNWIYENDSLTNLDGLSGLTSVFGELQIGENASLENIDGLGSMTQVRSMYVRDHPALTSIALDSLAYVTGNIIFNNNDSLCQSLFDALVAELEVLGTVGSSGNDESC